MRRKRKGRKVMNSFPKSYLRREITIDYFNSLGQKISDFGKRLISDEIELHQFISTVDSIFFNERCELSYLECVKILDVILVNNKINLSEKPIKEIFEEISIEEEVLLF